MHSLRAWMCCSLLTLWAASAAAEVGVVTLADVGSRVLRGATWYKMVAGARLEDADIIDTPERAQLQIELAAGSTINVVGGTLHVVRAAAAAAPAQVAFQHGWMKAVVKAPGIRVRTPQADIAGTDGVLVMRIAGAPEVFVESGEARLIELGPNANEIATHEMKRGEHWQKDADGRYAMVSGAPRAFVEAMPRHYADALPSLAARYKTAVPVLVADHDITYAEAEPWLAGRDRAAFEKRFASRLRDPAFRRAVEPHVARYPSWDRMLHPEKYAPKPPANAAP